MNDKQASCSDPDPGSFYNALHRALSPLKKEETGPNPRKAIVSLEENPMASSPSMPRICQLALITADSQYPHGSKQRLPPAPHPPGAGTPLPTPGTAVGVGGRSLPPGSSGGSIWGSTEVTLGLRSPPGRAGGVGLPRAAAPDPPEPDPLPPAVWTLPQPRHSPSRQPGLLDASVCGRHSLRAGSRCWIDGCRTADERDGALRIITKYTKRASRERSATDSCSPGPLYLLPDRLQIGGRRDGGRGGGASRKGIPGPAALPGPCHPSAPPLHPGSRRTFSPATSAPWRLPEMRTTSPGKERKTSLCWSRTQSGGGVPSFSLCHPSSLFSFGNLLHPAGAN